MEFGGIFILLLLVVVVAIVGGAIYAIAARGRQKQLSSKGGTLDAGREAGGETGDRPEHVEVENDQRSRFVGSR